MKRKDEMGQGGDTNFPPRTTSLYYQLFESWKGNAKNLRNTQGKRNVVRRQEEEGTRRRISLGEKKETGKEKPQTGKFFDISVASAPEVGQGVREFRRKGRQKKDLERDARSLESRGSERSWEKRRVGTKKKAKVL